MPDEERPEPRNVREAIAMRQAEGDPGFVEVTEEEAHTPYSDATLTEDDQILLESAPATDAEVPEPSGAQPEGDGSPAATSDHWAQFGGEQRVRDAVVIADALQTEQGVRAVVAQGLQALGYSQAQIAAALAAQEGAPAPTTQDAPPDPFADITDDDVVTGAELKQYLAGFAQRIEQTITQAQQQAVTPLQQQIQEERARTARATVDSTLIEVLKIADPTQLTDLHREQIADVQQFAQKYLDPNDWDPTHIRDALIRGHADMAARDERRLQAYIATKRQQRDSAPAHIGGASPAGGEEVKEPRNMKEAIAMRKAQNIF